MEKENLLLFVLVIILLVAMVLTLFLRGEKSRHGYGTFLPSRSKLVVQSPDPSCSEEGTHFARVKQL